MHKKIIIGVVIVIAIAGGVWYFNWQSHQPGPLDGLAMCLKDKGVIFYGAFWCPHCQNEKAIFGRSARLLPYVECSTPDGNSQTPECTAKGIKGYPTWIFPDGTRTEGEMTPQQLAEKSGCELPAKQ